MPEESTQTPEQADAQFDQALASVMNPETAAEPDKAAEGQPPEPATPSAVPVESSEVKPLGTEETPPEPTLDDKLSKIEEPEAKKEEPQLTPDQQKILSIIPNPQVAEQVQGLAVGYQNFTSKFAGGDFESVEGMLSSWNPEATEAFKEHLYQKYVQNGDWVERWITEKEGKADPAVKTLTRTVESLQAKLAADERAKQLQSHQQRVAEVGRQYETHIKNLFDLIEFADADRRWVRAAIDKLVGENKNALHAINSGQMSAINPLFKQAVKEYVERDKSTAQTKEKQKEIEAKHKALVPGGAITSTQGLPSNIKDVPKGKEDEWMDQELTALFSPKKK